MLSNTVISAIRTYVPLGIGALLTFLASSLHVVIDPSSQAGLVALCVAVLSAAYWSVVKLIERKVPKAGVLLGYPSAPIYEPAAPQPVTPAPAPVPAAPVPAPAKKAAKKAPAKKAAAKVDPDHMHTDDQPTG